MGIINNNLPADSQPWGREVDKRLDTIEKSVADNEVNDLARDKQLRSSLSKVAELTNLNNDAIDYLNDQSTYIALKPDPDAYIIPSTGSSASITQHQPGFQFVITIDKPKIIIIKHVVNADVNDYYTSGTTSGTDAFLATSKIKVDGVEVNSAYYLNGAF